jgi:hypothetical protein
MASSRKTLNIRLQTYVHSVAANVRLMFGLKHGKLGDNINIFKPGYHLGSVKNVVTRLRKTKHETPRRQSPYK